MQRNRIRCKKCGDIIESTYTHNFVSCSCGACFVDGGNEYYRWGGEPDDREELTQEVLVDKYDVLKIKMSATAKKKVEAMEGREYLSFNDKRALACVMLCAWRYAKNRHYTQAIRSFGMDEMIIENIKLMPYDYIRQIVDDINQEYNAWDDMTEEEKKELVTNVSPHYLDYFREALIAELEWRDASGKGYGYLE